MLKDMWTMKLSRELRNSPTEIWSSAYGQKFKGNSMERKVFSTSGAGITRHQQARKINQLITSAHTLYIKKISQIHC